MRQALHIFKKDTRYLRSAILLLLAMAALLGWSKAGLAELLVVLAANYTIARLIHAEAIPGHNQFWITRPYRWKSLLGAKILFILVFVNLPLLATQCYIILDGRFSFAASLPGLIWSQVLLVLCVSLPAMCLASLTAGLIPFLLAEFLLAGAVFIAEALRIRTQFAAFLPGMQAGPATVEWVQDSLVLAVIMCVAIFVLRWQYKTRRTDLGSRYAIAGAAATAVIFLFLPWQFAMRAQSALSSQPFDGSSLNLSLASVTKSVFPPAFAREKNPHPAGEVSLPIVVKGDQDSRDLEADALTITLESVDGRNWNSGYIAPIMREEHSTGNAAETVIVGNLRVDPAFFNAEGTRPVTARTTLYLTLFGDPQSKTIPIQPEPVNAIDGLQCFAGLFNQLHCRSIFRWPRRRVYARTGEGGVESFIRSVSYSPFPATLGFDPIEEHSFSGATTATQATIITKKPLSHFHVDAEIRGITLKDYTAEAQRKALSAPPPP
jgi:hypothetical protein